MSALRTVAGLTESAGLPVDCQLATGLRNCQIAEVPVITVWEWSEFSRVFVGIGWFCLIPALFCLASPTMFLRARRSPAGI